MSYEIYKDTGKCLGKALYQLAKIGVPVHIVSSVIFIKTNEIKYDDRLFATYKWNEHGTPVFSFQVPYDYFCGLEQDPIYTIFESRDYGEAYSEINSFSFTNPCVEPTGLLFKTYKIYNKNGELVGKDLKPVVKQISAIEDKVARLAAKFNTSRK